MGVKKKVLKYVLKNDGRVRDMSRSRCFDLLVK